MHPLTYTHPGIPSLVGLGLASLLFASNPSTICNTLVLGLSILTSSAISILPSLLPSELTFDNPLFLL